MKKLPPRGSNKGHKWRAPIKAEPWRGPILSWDEIKGSFPGIQCPEVAIKRTAERCKKLGLIRTNVTGPVTDSMYSAIRQKQARERKAQA